MSSVEVCKQMFENMKDIDFPNVRNRIYGKEEMSGCHEPKENKGNTHHCEGCGVVINDCTCIWNNFRNLYEMLRDLSIKSDQQWDLMYKTQDNLSKRIHEVSDTCIHNNGIICKDLNRLEERVNTINSNVLTAGATEMFIESNVRNIHKRIDELPSSDYDERINSLENINIEKRLISLESEHLANCLDPKVWVHVAERLDKLESVSSRAEILCDNFGMMIERVLEPNVTNLHKRIDELETQVKELNRYQDVTHAQHRLFVNRKLPHKCPSCDLTGAIMIENMEEAARFDSNVVMKTNDGRLFIWCKSCKGEGIVWG